MELSGVCLLGVDVCLANDTAGDVGTSMLADPGDGALFCSNCGRKGNVLAAGLVLGVDPGCDLGEDN